MPLSANLKLSTNRPIVIHPHYEDTALRNRVKRVYSLLYGFRPYTELHSLLKTEFKAKYLIVERHFCESHPPGKPECGLASIVHLDMTKTDKKQTCLVILAQHNNSFKYFVKVFTIGHVTIFKIL